MTFRTLLAASLPLFLVAPVALAQDAPPVRTERPAPGPRGGAMRGVGIDRMAEQLGLSADQKTRVQQLFEGQRTRMQPQMQALRADQSLTAEQRRERMQAFAQQQRTAMEQGLRGILTPEQFTRYQQLRPAQGGPMQDRRMQGQRLERRGEQMQQRGRQLEQRGERLQRGARPAMPDRLGLSDAQKAQMQALAQQQRTALQALQAERLTVDERRTRVQALRQQFQQQRLSVLTPAQRQQAEQLRQERGQRRGPQMPRPRGGR